jgi:hypothetical protein
VRQEFGADADAAVADDDLDVGIDRSSRTWMRPPRADLPLRHRCARRPRLETSVRTSPWREGWGIREGLPGAPERVYRRYWIPDCGSVTLEKKALNSTPVRAVAASVTLWTMVSRSSSDATVLAMVFSFSPPPPAAAMGHELVALRVTRDRRGPTDGAVVVANRRDGQRNRYEGVVLSAAHRLEVPDRFPFPDAA